MGDTNNDSVLLDIILASLIIGGAIYFLENKFGDNNQQGQAVADILSSRQSVMEDQPIVIDVVSDDGQFPANELIDYEAQTVDYGVNDYRFGSLTPVGVTGSNGY